MSVQRKQPTDIKGGGGDGVEKVFVNSIDGNISRWNGTK